MDEANIPRSGTSYKVIRLIAGESNIPTNWCTYWRYFCLSCIVISIVVLLVVTCLYFMLFAVVRLIGFYFGLWDFMIAVSNFWRVSLQLGVILWCAGLLVSLCFAVVRIFKYYSEQRRIRAMKDKLDPDYVPKPPGVFSIWLSAKKAKICPPIKFTD